MATQVGTITPLLECDNGEDHLPTVGQARPNVQRSTNPILAQFLEASSLIVLTTRFDDALSFTSDLHRGQRRKGTDIPYISHLLAVSGLVLENGGDEDQAIAGLLHDAAEDRGGEATLKPIEQSYGPSVAAMVSDCTDAWTDPKPPWKERKEAYLAHLPSTPARSLLVSLADKTHNARAIVLDHSMIGSAIWKRFNVGRDDTLWYYNALQFFAVALPHLCLTKEFKRLVAVLQSCE